MEWTQIVADIPLGSLVCACRDGKAWRIGITITEPDDEGDVWMCSMAWADVGGKDFTITDDFRKVSNRNVMLQSNTTEVWYVPTTILTELADCYTENVLGDVLYREKVTRMIFEVASHVFRDIVL